MTGTRRLHQDNALDLIESNSILKGMFTNYLRGKGLSKVTLRRLQETEVNGSTQYKIEYTRKEGEESIDAYVVFAYTVH